MDGWIIWYEDRSSFSSWDGLPWEAPRDGVICITVSKDSCGRYLISARNYYCWHFDEQRWIPHDKDGLLQYLRRPGKDKVVLEGWEVSKELFGEIINHAMKSDERLPSKTANGPTWRGDG